VALGAPVTRLKTITVLTPVQNACLAGFEAGIKNAAAVDAKTDLVQKVKYWSKLDALEKLAEHLGLLEGQGERPADVSAFTLPRHQRHQGALKVANRVSTFCNCDQKCFW
jgi:hypothetical protein